MTDIHRAVPVAQYPAVAVARCDMKRGQTITEDMIGDMEGGPLLAFARRLVALFDDHAPKDVSLPCKPGQGAEAMVRIDSATYPEIIQAARWSDADNGTNHFEPGVGFIVDDPDGLPVPVRWDPHLALIEAALAGLDHTAPHPLDVDTIEWLVREGRKPTLFESAVYCFVSGEHTPVTAMQRSSEDLWVAGRFLNEYFEGWSFNPASGFDPAQPRDDRLTGEEAWDLLVNVDDRTSPEEYPDMCLITRDELVDFMSRAKAKI